MHVRTLSFTLYFTFQIEHVYFRRLSLSIYLILKHFVSDRILSLTLHFILKHYVYFITLSLTIYLIVKTLFFILKQYVNVRTLFYHFYSLCVC